MDSPGIYGGLAVRRRERVLIGASLVALAGVAVLFGAILWLLWQESVAAEETYVGNLAERLGERTETIILDTRDLLASLDRLDVPRCSQAHLDAMQQAAIARPYLRAIGHWRAAERQCSVGFLQGEGLKPPHADRIYDNGVIAWWPSRWTEVGGVQLFLIRYGDHDAAIDPRMLLDLDPLGARQAGLWVEGLRLAATPWDATLPDPQSVPVGLTVDAEHQRVLSRFSRNALFPIDIVAIEPLGTFWSRHERLLLAGAGFGLLLVIAWIMLVLRYSRRQLSLVTELKLALARGRIGVQYQPVIELETGRCVGAEALARWQRENGETVPPDVFVPIAEAAGLVPQITRAVLRATLADLEPLLTTTPGFAINLNLAPEDLKGDGFGAALAAGLADAGLPCTAIKLEITERALVNSDTSRALIRSFRERGHQVAIDDFGTGYSSLSYLQSFELDVLKIDKSFVDAIGTEAATSQVIVHVIDMARSLGLDMVAEGVQSPRQLEWLLEHGVQYGQGFLFSVPLSAANLIAFVRDHRSGGSGHRWRRRPVLVRQVPAA